MKINLVRAFEIFSFSVLFIFSGCKKKISAENAVAIAENDDSAVIELSQNSSTSEIANNLDFEAVENKMAKELEAFKKLQSSALDSIDSNNKLKEMQNKDGLLFASEFGTEIIESDTVDNQRVMIYAIGSSVTRNFFDEQYRLLKKEFWEISDVENSKIIKTEFYEYQNESINPKIKKVLSENREDVFFYLESGKISKNQLFKIVDDKSYLLKNVVWKYNSDSEVIQILTTNYNYKSEESIKNPVRSTNRYDYFYNKNPEIEPDLKYYENDELKIYNKYSDVKGNYYTVVSFENSLYVITNYENYSKRKERVVQNNKVIREKDYDYE